MATVWSPKEVNVLTKCVRDYQHLIKQLGRLQVFNIVSSELESSGIYRSPEACRKKWYKLSESPSSEDDESEGQSGSDSESESGSESESESELELGLDLKLESKPHLGADSPMHGRWTRAEKAILYQTVRNEIVSNNGSMPFNLMNAARKVFVTLKDRGFYRQERSVRNCLERTKKKWKKWETRATSKNISLIVKLQIPRLILSRFDGEDSITVDCGRSVSKSLEDQPLPSNVFAVLQKKPVDNSSIAMSTQSGRSERETEAHQVAPPAKKVSLAEMVQQAKVKIERERKDPAIKVEPDLLKRKSHGEDPTTSSKRARNTDDFEPRNSAFQVRWDSWPAEGTVKTRPEVLHSRKVALEKRRIEQQIADSQERQKNHIARFVTQNAKVREGMKAACLIEKEFNAEAENECRLKKELMNTMLFGYDGN